MILSFDSQCDAQPFPSSAVEQLLWVAPEYKRRHKHLVEIGAADCRDIVRIAEVALGSRRCEFGASPMHAICRVERKGVEWTSHGEEGRDLRRREGNTTVELDECCKSSQNHPKDGTWSTCSKNHAGRWLVSATSGGKRRIVPRPNDGISVNLLESLSVTCLLGGCGPHRSLSMSIRPGSTTCIIRSRCIRTDFRTLSSNSCNKSTTRIGNNLNPKGDNCSQKEF